MPHTMTRAAYAQMFGPTVGDKVRQSLGDAASAAAGQSIPIEGRFRALHEFLNREDAVFK